MEDNGELMITGKLTDDLENIIKAIYVKCFADEPEIKATDILYRFLIGFIQSAGEFYKREGIEVIELDLKDVSPLAPILGAFANEFLHSLREQGASMRAVTQDGREIPVPDDETPQFDIRPEKEKSTKRVIH